MVTPSVGAITQLDIKRAFTEILDAKGKVVKFEQKKDTNPPVFEGKGTDGNTYSFGLSEALVGVTVVPKSPEQQGTSEEKSRPSSSERGRPEIRRRDKEGRRGATGKIR